MFYVYYLQSIFYPNKTYIGFTSNLKQRFTDHNSGKSVYTEEFKPWKIISFSGFDTKLKARKFKKYLKSHAGRIFLNRYAMAN